MENYPRMPIQARCVREFINSYAVLPLECRLGWWVKQWWSSRVQRGSTRVSRDQRGWFSFSQKKASVVVATLTFLRCPGWCGGWFPGWSRNTWGMFQDLHFSWQWVFGDPWHTPACESGKKAGWKGGWRWLVWISTGLCFFGTRANLKWNLTDYLFKVSSVHCRRYSSRKEWALWIRDIARIS